MPPPRSLPYRSHRVRSPDGVELRAQEWGTPGGAPILFVHGFCQSHLCWLPQLRGPLAEAFRLITFDLRGHGDSAKPDDPAAYRESARWAGDLHALIEQLELVRPVVVAWSYGGRVVNDYLLHHGDAALGGIDYIAATSTEGPGVRGPGGALIPAMASDDLATRLESTRAFLELCFQVPLPPGEMARALAYNMVVPAAVRRWMWERRAQYDAVLRALRVPVRVTHGRRDAVVALAMSEHTLARVKHAQVAIYEDAGHAPFVEAAGRYGADLARFVREIQGAG